MNRVDRIGASLFPEWPSALQKASLFRIPAVIPAMPYQELRYKQYAAEKIEKGETSMKRERLWWLCLV
ncbi:MAG: hypothetical protein AB2L14_03385 [Candidatus Xenobiia bacterium LiM19]